MVIAKERFFLFNLKAIPNFPLSGKKKVNMLSVQNSFHIQWNKSEGTMTSENFYLSCEY